MRADNAAGDSACLSCHEEKATFGETAHHLTSRLPTRESILGSFRPGENVLRTSNPGLYYRMDSAASGFYQTAVLGTPPDTSVRSERIAYVTGVRKGQSFLYWSGDRLYQLPVSYWDGLGWANSPGYPEGRPNLDRPIPPRCLECHATWFESIPDPLAVNRYQQSSVILGISCETCHGAGPEHVRRERSALGKLLPPAIINPTDLPRERQLDACALCHGGTMPPLQSAAFTFVPGQSLERQFNLWASPDTLQVDVHGNQVALLKQSACFRASQMTCATCHDVHREERDAAALSGRCLTCHAVQSLTPRHQEDLTGECVDCHMPVLPSNAVLSSDLGRQGRAWVRTHWIKVYPELPSP